MNRFPLNGTGFASERDPEKVAIGDLPNTVVSDSSPHGASAGVGLTFNGSAFVGDTRPIDLWNTQTNPGAVTDWGAIINTLLAGGTRALYLGPHAFPHSTHIDAHNLMGVAFIGPGGKDDHYGDSGAGSPPIMPAYLRYTAAGAGSALDLSGSSGAVLRGVGVYYDNPAFTGDVVLLGNQADGAVIEENDIGGYRQTVYSAHSCIKHTDSWNNTIRSNAIHDAQYGIYGNSDDGTVWSDSLRILANDMAFFTVAHLGGGIHQMWHIRDNFFGLIPPPAAPGGTPWPRVMYCPQLTVTGYVAWFIFSGNDIWDQPTFNQSLYQRLFEFGQRVNAVFEGNEIPCDGGSQPIMKFTNGGWLRIVNNPQICNGINQTVPPIDPGNTGTGASAFERLIVRGNGDTGSTVVAVGNLPGHFGVEIDGSSHNRVRAMHEVSGQERLQWSFYEARPTIAPQAALGTGATASITGTDIAGNVKLVAGTGPTAGDFAQITLGTALIADPIGDYGSVAPGDAGFNIQLTSYYEGGAPPQPPPVFYFWFTKTDPLHWFIGSKSALVAGYDYRIAYRILVL